MYTLAGITCIKTRSVRVQGFLTTVVPFLGVPMIGIPTQSGLVLGSLFTTKSQVLIRLALGLKSSNPMRH